MLAFPSMLVPPAKEAGMKVPPDPDKFDQEEFPHFAVFCVTQLCRAMSSPGEHWSNAKVLAAIPDDRIKEITVDELIALGFVA